MGLLNAHYDQINVPCNVTTSATDHKYGGAELRDTMGTWEKDISFGDTVILCTDIHHRMHLTINRIEKACMLFPWFQVFSLVLFARYQFRIMLSMCCLTAWCALLMCCPQQMQQ